MTGYPKRSPLPGIYPIPPFSGWVTVTALRYQRPDDAIPFGAMLGLYNRKLELIGTSLWQSESMFITVPPGTIFGQTLPCRFGCDEYAVPNGAEWWALSAPTPATGPTFRDPAPRVLYDPYFRVRWRLHI